MSNYSYFLTKKLTPVQLFMARFDRFNNTDRKLLCAGNFQIVKPVKPDFAVVNNTTMFQQGQMLGNIGLGGADPTDNQPDSFFPASQ